MNNIPFQYEIRPELPNVYGVLEYRKFRETLIKIDEILNKSELEDRLIKTAIEKYAKDNEIEEKKFYKSKFSIFQYKKFRHALRCNIARHLTGESYRLFSIRMADSELFQWFTCINAFSSRKAISKSSLERYEKYFDEPTINENICEWLADLRQDDKASAIGLDKAICYKKTFTDSTCIKANIHFPLDWVLLRDAVRSLILAIKTVRKQGLKHRMIEPQLFLKKINNCCIRMTHTRRKANSKKQQKIIFRGMKKLSKCVVRHAENYRKLLESEWEKTTWSYKQTQQVLSRIDLILHQFPEAIKQAHERIIGERLVASKEKILSLYDKNAHVIVRGKAGGEIEFGQGLLITEQENGLIIDWELFAKEQPSDNKLLQSTMTRIEKRYGCIGSLCTDRAFNDKHNDAYLEKHKIYNATCPRSPKQFQEKLSDPVFLALQTRRSQTEARIGIFKNVFLGKPLRSRIHQYKKIAVSWCILTHNLWLLARMASDIEKSMLKKVA